MKGTDKVYPYDFTSHSRGNIESGITKREYFAAMALQGILAAGGKYPEDVILTRPTQNAVAYADALIEALNK